MSISRIIGPCSSTYFFAKETACQHSHGNQPRVVLQQCGSTGSQYVPASYRRWQTVAWWPCFACQCSVLSSSMPATRSNATECWDIQSIYNSCHNLCLDADACRGFRQMQQAGPVTCHVNTSCMHDKNYLLHCKHIHAVNLEARGVVSSCVKG